MAGFVSSCDIALMQPKLILKQAISKRHINASHYHEETNNEYLSSHNRPPLSRAPQLLSLQNRYLLATTHDMLTLLSC